MNTEIFMQIGEQTEDITKSMFHELLKKHGEKMVANLRCSHFIFDFVDKTQYSCNKISLNRRGTFVKSRDWLKHEKAISNPKHLKAEKFFKHAITIVIILP